MISESLKWFLLLNEKFQGVAVCAYVCGITLVHLQAVFVFSLEEWNVFPFFDHVIISYIHHLIPRVWPVSVEQSASRAGARGWVHWCSGQWIDSLFSLSIRMDTAAPTTFAHNRFLMQNGAVNTPSLPPRRSSRSGSEVQPCSGISGAVSSCVAEWVKCWRENRRPLSVSLAICLFVKALSTSSVEQAFVWWGKVGGEFPGIHLPWKYGTICRLK